MEMKMLFYLLWVISLWVSFTGSFESRIQRPPIVALLALLGLLGMVLGEQLGISVKKLDVPGVVSVCLIGESYDGQSPSNRLKLWQRAEFVPQTD